ncbi:EAL domain, c-di-GMP-specific phosphodiesterase class I (or its enzymatically inactive variant) [Lachnospiraceae bacterium KHCPX20]|nr:EAL domain, c-di-GMP-specific phosphodiesterase class I (or its enzymatically inactive variant) [Lachnospiraceae bacterium KHCPX20]
MYNIQVQTAALCMVLVVLFFSVIQKNLMLRGRKIFYLLIATTVVTLILDIASVIAISESRRLGEWLVILVCKAYIVALVAGSFVGLIYSAEEYFLGHVKRHTRVFYIVTFAIAVAGIVVLPIHYVQKGRIVYTYGPACLVTYVFAIFYIISTISTCFVYSERISAKRRKAILVWQGIWIYFAIVQFVRQDLLLVSLAMALGVVILYSELENSEAFIDRSTGVFSSHALMEYMQDLFEQGIFFSSMDIFMQYRSHGLDLATERQIHLAMVRMLKRYQPALIFRGSSSSFTMIFLSREEQNCAFEEIRQEFNDMISLPDGREIPMKLNYIIYPDSTLASSADDAFEFRNYFMSELDKKDVIVVDKIAVSRVREYQDIREMITYALDHDRLEIYYQPIYNIADQSFTSAEALVRIRDRNGRLVPPTLFIPIAEENGMILRIGEYVYRSVCQCIRDQKPQRYGLHYIEVNLSVAQCEQEDLADQFHRIALDYDIDPKMINLEITETAGSSATKTLLANMRKLKSLGFTFSLDDFGTGRSNLDYISEMPASIVKFDRSFTLGYFYNEKTRFLMNGVIKMIRDMGLSIVSEGVETREQYDTMTGLGVNYIQGYFFSRPIPEREFLAFIKKYSETPWIVEPEEK